MDAQLLKKVIDLRRNLHQYPEVSLKEFQTRQKIFDILLSFGVPQQSFHKSYQNLPTALVVDLRGQAQPQGRQYCVAFRADTDALNMVEENQNLQYKSKNHGAAHMCGHDGHVACLVGFVPLFLAQLKKIPSNKTIRLLFQPSEEGPISGAELMIKQGCLQGVNQVYGFHNLPIGNFGDLWCKEGPVMSLMTILKIIITGTGGHGSEPDRCKVAVWKAVDFYQKLQSFLNNLKKQNADKEFVCTLPVFQTGQRYNVISQSVRLQGTLRSFDQKIRQTVTDKIKQLLKQIQNDGFSVQYEASSSVVTSNTKAQSDNIIRVAKQVLGNDKVGKGILPLKASEDFGFYTKQKPGAYFFFCTKSKEDDVICHNSRFDFNDNIIEIAANFWYRLALDRLNSE